ncbi:uncharacterized protein LOC111289839 isoform X2 [Durio zibethinus]|uniref:Uncharacterized protein LOC111289839 isoform X2 n=1 Tax=Durio zibethinus TaxID=66656 RepID=A0A6P5YA92_DURZI|nr:uncharacterized protein LOC111289839 isoform X2 [Durio zibethinus]
MVTQIESEKKKSSETIKFLCSYGELMVKLVEFCGYSVTLRCQLPNGDLDTLILIKSDEDLTNIIAEYDEAALMSTSAPSKIRAILSPPKSLKQISPPLSNTSSVNFSSSKSSDSGSPVKARFRPRSFSPPPPMAYSVRACYHSCHPLQNPRVFFNAPCSNCWH